MRFFSGTRDNSTKKGASASQMYKDRLQSKGQPEGMKAVKEDQYKRILEDKMAKMMEDYILGKKKNATKLPGTKQDDGPPKEPSKNALMMIRMLAMKRAQKDFKAQRKRELEFLKEEKAKKALKKKEILFEEETRLKKEMEFKIEEEAKQKSWAAFWGTDTDNKGWW